MPTRRQLIQKITLNANASSVTFSNIPQNYTDLKLVCSLRGSINAVWGTFSVQFNEVDTATYSNRRLVGSGTAASSGGDSNVLAIFGIANGSTSTANTFTNCEFYIPNYTSNSSKSVQSVCALENNGTEAYITKWAQLAGGVTLPITSIKLFDRYGGWGNMIANSTFYLYGITHVPIIRGGEVSIAGGFKYHIFKSSGSLQVIEPGDLEYLVVGGGGGASNGGGIGAGGGGGAVSYGKSRISTGNTAVVIGAGGAAGGNGTDPGISGTASQFGTLSASVTNNATGGVTAGGNGGNCQKTLSGTTTSYTGGTGQSGNGSRRGGSGAGAGANGSSSYPAVGGNGASEFSTWASATASGHAGYYAGGGAGGFEQNSAGTQTSGGLGGGGLGGSGTAAPAYNGTNGLVNTGGGGGGCGGQYFVVGGASGNGGSGIVIIRYPYDGN